jgi:hypothetical protein
MKRSAETRAKISAALRGRKHSPEHCAACRRAKGGLNDQQYAWLREHFNLHTNVELAMIFGKTPRAIEHILKRAGLSKNEKARGWRWRKGHPKGFSGHAHTAVSRKVMGQRSRAAWADPKSKLNTEEHRQLLSDRKAATIKNGRARFCYSRSRAGKRNDLGGLYVRSSWEANYARYLNWLLGRGEIKAWGYEKVTFDFPVRRGTRFYTPDFQVTENDGSVIYHEVKGWMTQKGQTALNRMRIHHPGVKIILIAEKEYRALAKWKALIEGWE